MAPYCYIIEWTDGTVQHLKAVWNLAEAQADYAWLEGKPKRLIPVREPLSRNDVASAWKEARLFATGDKDTMAPLLAFAELIQHGQAVRKEPQ